MAAHWASSPTGVLAFALALSSIALLGGPLILSLGRGRAATGALVDGLTLGLVPTMVVLRLLPHVTEGLGMTALALAATAFLVLRWFDSAHHRAAARVGRAFIYSALALHSFTDGVSLAAALAASPTRGTMDLTLTLAFVIHRLPEGLFIATTLLPSYGWRRTLLRTLGLVGATIAGGVIGGWLLPHLPERLFDAVVAVGLGAMLQLVVHSHTDRAASAATRGLGGAALLAGVAIAVMVPAPHDLLRLAQPSELPIVRTLAPLFIETAPVLLVGLVIAAVAQASVRARAPLGRGPGAAWGGLAFALTIPVGPSGVLPVARGLLAQGAPAAAVAAFIRAAPAIGLTTALLSLRLLGVALTLGQLVCAGLLALCAGLVAAKTSSARITSVGRTARVRPTETTDAAAVPMLVRRAIDQLAVWYLAGLLVAAALEASLDPALIAQLGPSITISACVLVALPLHVPLVALLPAVMVLLHKGISPSGALVLLVLAPTASLGGLRLLRGRGRALLVALGATLALIAAQLASGPSPAVHILVTHDHNAVEWVGAAVMALLLVGSLLRLGPRLWFAQLTLEGKAPGDAHGHGHAKHAH